MVEGVHSRDPAQGRLLGLLLVVLGAGAWFALNSLWLLNGKQSEEEEYTLKPTVSRPEIKVRDTWEETRQLDFK